MSYIFKFQRVEQWVRRYPTSTLASGEGWVFLQEIDRLRAELEREQMRLAACGVVAMANTPDTAAKARDILPEYRSASCDDVARAVDENMKLRAAIERVRALHATDKRGNCPECLEWIDSDLRVAIGPCRTLRALDGEDA